MGDIINFKNYKSSSNKKNVDKNSRDNKYNSPKGNNSNIIKMDISSIPEEEFLAERKRVVEQILSSPDFMKGFCREITSVCHEYAKAYAKEVGVPDIVLMDILCDEALDAFLKKIIARRYARYDKLRELLEKMLIKDDDKNK